MKLREIKPGMVIHCKSKDEYMALLDELKRLGYVWYTRREIEVTVDADKYCSRPTIHIYDKEPSDPYKHITSTFKEGNVEFSDLIIPELSPAEVLKICNEICKTVGPCDNCKMAGNCFAERDSDYQKVVEICEQWKADHEKKESEVEWFWQGCIYKVLDSGTVTQLTEGEGIYDTGCEFRESAEEYMADILKEFCKEHEGNFIATVEHVCRVKK